MLVELKINGKPITVDTDKMHQTWIDKCLAYGVRRLPNDAHSAEKGDVKFESVQLLVKEMMSGNEAPAKISGGGSSVDPVQALAQRNARADLTAMFKTITGKGKAMEFAEHEKIAKFYNVSDDKATWDNSVVDKWIAAQKASGKRDYAGEAKTTLAKAEGKADELEAVLDF